MNNKYKIDGRIFLFLILLILAATFALYADSTWGINEIKKDILIEFHGLVFDLFVFGLGLTGYEIYRENRERKREEKRKRDETIARYKEELNDYRYWKNEEASFRIRGLIKRLAAHNEVPIDLNNCWLPDNTLHVYIPNMQGWDFSMSVLKNSQFYNFNFNNAGFYASNLDNVKFFECQLQKSDFKSQDLRKVRFEKCNLTDAKIGGAKVPSFDWFQTLKALGNTGVESLEAEYTVVNSMADDGITPPLYMVWPKTSLRVLNMLGVDTP